MTKSRKELIRDAFTELNPDEFTDGNRKFRELFVIFFGITLFMGVLIAFLSVFNIISREIFLGALICLIPMLILFGIHLNMD